MSKFLDKSRIYPLVLVIAVLIVWSIRQKSNGESEGLISVELSGKTMGNIIYNVKYLEKNGINHKSSIDSLLFEFNQSLSTYIPESEISQFNQGTIFRFKSPYFFPVLKRSKEIYESTKGAFDPTIAPLVNAWGFGPEKRTIPDSATVKSLLQLVNFDSVYFDSVSVCKMQAGMKLDLSAIAKGYAVDVVADFLKSRGIQNMMVEIGGEAICFGTNNRDEVWTIGIDDPTTDRGSQLRAIVRLKDKAIATSGNYRNYYVVDGKRHSHTISPYTGFPVQHTLLSASVFADDCMSADAFATAFMVLGLEESKKILDNDKTIDAHFIYSDGNGNLMTYTSEGISESIIIR